MKHFNIVGLIFILLGTISCEKEKEVSASFSFLKDNEMSPCIVTFTNESVNADSYLWDFGDGKTSSEAEPLHTYYRSGIFKVSLTASSGSLSSVKELDVEVKTGGVEISAVPLSLGLDPFYKQYSDANGIPIISSDKVPEEALLKTRSIILTMLSLRDDVRLKMIEYDARVGVIGKDEVTTDMPEYAFLKDDPNTNWDERARGLGGTIWVPLSTGAEENIMCYSNDRYSKEDILIHEFSHAVHLMGIKYVEPDFETRLEALYTDALASGKWANTYAAVNFQEYWAEGVQDWFNVNAESSPADGVHNYVNTRNELQSYDPGLYNLISEYFPALSTGSCHE